MTIQDQLLQDMKAAMKAKEAGKVELSVIRMVRSALKNEEIHLHRPLVDEDVLAVLAKEKKMREDSLLEFQKTDRNDLVAQTQAEIDVLMRYLPQPLTEAEVREMIRTVIRDESIEPMNFGTIMKAVMPHLKGRADGRTVQTIVKELLAEQ